MALTNLNAAPAWTQQSVNSALNGRLHISSFLPSAVGVTGMTGWRDGVVASTNQGGVASNVPADLQIKQAVSPSLNLLCDPGHCVITRSGQGPYLSYLLTQGTLTLANADPVNPRIDLIVAQVYDAALGDGMPTTPALASPGGLVIRAETGIAAGSPVAKPVPPGAIPLAWVTVAANATTITNANIADKRKVAFTPAGARTLLGGDSASDAGAVSGEMRFTPNAIDNGVRVWNGAAWKPVGPPVFANIPAMVAAIPSPYQNETAWVNDENRLYRWNGSGWVIAKATGYKGNSQSLSAQINYTTGQLFKSQTFTAETSHIYKCSALLNLSTISGASVATLTWRWALGATVTTAGTDFGGNPHEPDTGKHSLITPWRSLAWGGAGGQVTVGLFISGTGSGVFTNAAEAREILVEDMI